MAESVYDIPVKRIDGTPTKLDAYRGKVLLVVNVASQCGLTPQYTGLEKLYKSKHAQGLEVLGFPANNFGAQEPGTDAQIASFCSTSYDVSFPMFSKISVKGADQHALYRNLTSAHPRQKDAETFREKLKGYGMDPGQPGEVLWNFEKFLIDRRGTVVERFSPDIPADDPRITTAVDRELAKPT